MRIRSIVLILLFGLSVDFSDALRQLWTVRGNLQVNGPWLDGSGFGPTGEQPP